MYTIMYIEAVQVTTCTDLHPVHYNINHDLHFLWLQRSDFKY